MHSIGSELLVSLHDDLNSGQKAALALMEGDANVFLTGGAGTGKSYVLRKFLKGVSEDKFPILASTGSAAILVGGRTFHSYFGLGIMEGGPEAAFERATTDKRVGRRLRKARGIVVDEISMIPGEVLATAERIASTLREDPRPWGGLKVIAVGDFAQLPPVNRDSKPRDWAFKNPVWEKSQFLATSLDEIMRSQGDFAFHEFLADVRVGRVSERVRVLLDGSSEGRDPSDLDYTVLHSRRVDVERINLKRLSELPGKSRAYETNYTGEDWQKKNLMSSAPIPPVLEIKKDALVMLRQNDPMGRWVNGSMGHVKDFDENEIEVKLLQGPSVFLEKTRFTILNAEGNEVAAAKNFPLSLAYALTIHKAQGTTLDRMRVTLNNLWEPGQAYVALSRVRGAAGLWVDGWSESSIFADPEVLRFHANL